MTIDRFFAVALSMLTGMLLVFGVMLFFGRS